jgi:hypothetical protein
MCMTRHLGTSRCTKPLQSSLAKIGNSAAAITGSGLHSGLEDPLAMAANCDFVEDDDIPTLLVLT